MTVLRIVARKKMSVEINEREHFWKWVCEKKLKRRVQRGGIE
jgi:uncharacterized NAD(P)/FAD-binding protein YdhS